MKKALLTGATGFIGRNIKPILENNYQLLIPQRDILNLKDENQVAEYLEKNEIEVIFHCANPNPSKNNLDQQCFMAEDSLRIFMNLYKNRNVFDKMIFLGSGAQYDKELEISNITEAEIGRSVPRDSYGFAKYVMNELAAGTDNIYNLCVFGCYGPGDAESKFITHCIRCCLNSSPITIRQDCKFDYLQVTDLGRMLSWMGTAKLKHHMYNASGNNHRFLSEIAATIKSKMESKEEIVLLKQGLNKEYTACGERFWTEADTAQPMKIEDGIQIQIEWEKLHHEKKSC